MLFTRALRRFLIGYVLLHLVAAILFVWVVTRVARNEMIENTRGRMEAMALMLREHVNELDGGIQDTDLISHVQSLGQETGYRFTVVTGDGVVVVDSKTGTEDIGFHGDRPEILDAGKAGVGFAQRYSTTLEMPMLYLAIPASRDNKPTNGFIRIAVPAVSINAAIQPLRRYTWMFAIAISLLTVFLMVLLSASTMKPLNFFTESARKIGVGDYDLGPRLKRSDEWGELSDAFAQMQSELALRERRLMQNHQRLEAVLSSMIEGVLSVDPEGVVRIANSAACRMLTIDESELVGKKLLEVIRIPELTAAVENTIDQLTFTKAEFKTLTEPRRTIKARVAPLQNEREPGLAVVLHDVTELRLLESMRRDFAANVSHELKTPLASIKAYAETLRLGAINDEAKNLQFLEQIENQAENLDLQIKDLLEISRIESRQTKFQLSPVAVNEVCRTCVELQSTVSRKAAVHLNFEPGDGTIVAQTDADSVATILNNLLSNAIHYTPSEGNVTVKTFKQEEMIVIQVKDTGIGIAPDQQARIFERFYRVDKARSREKGGTGLGLAIVKHLTLALGGSVHLDSRIGKGSTFEIHLPVAAA